MATRAWPLSVEAWGEEGEWLVSRGHWPSTEFMAAVREYLSEACGEDPADYPDAEFTARVVQGYYTSRPVLPCEENSYGRGTRFFCRRGGPGRGAIPFTGVSLA